MFPIWPIDVALPEDFASIMRSMASSVDSAISESQPCSCLFLAAWGLISLTIQAAPAITAAFA